MQPGVLALIVGSGITVLLLFFAAILGLKILFRWDIRSNSEEQLGLERKTYLVSTLVQYGLLFEVVSLFLFIYTADDIHNLLVGAMCATGSLNANAYGFPALYAKIATLFLSGSWIALNYIDNKAEDYPLTRTKYRLLLAIFPVVLAGYVLQTEYFSRISPNVITSCCGVLFSEGSKGIASSIAFLPARPMQSVFYSLFAVTAMTGVAAIRTGTRMYFVSFSFLSGVFFIASIAAILSFISLYFYQLPTHHCPFDVLQSGYYYAGYPLYASLFAGCFFGIMTGVVEPFRKIGSLSHVIPLVQRRWALVSILAIALFVAISLAPVVFLPFKLGGY
ncbi:MAG: hypothetical protein P8013_05960 [Candidatus Sulfobium sp.]